MNSMAAEVRRALVRHFEQRARVGTPAPEGGAVEAGAVARTGAGPGWVSDADSCSSNVE
jgi:hypothetical protein